MKRLALAIILALVPSMASADCIATTMNGLAIAQTGDILSTNGPVTSFFPGGFQTQNAGKCNGPDLPVVPGAPPCRIIEGVLVTSRAGCVKSVYTGFGCGTLVHLAIRLPENAIVGGQLRRAYRTKDPTDRASYLAIANMWRKDLCFLDGAISFGYAGIVWPNNLRADYDIAKRGAAVSPGTIVPQFNVTVRRWSF